MKTEEQLDKELLEMDLNGRDEFYTHLIQQEINMWIKQVSKTYNIEKEEVDLLIKRRGFNELEGEKLRTLAKWFDTNVEDIVRVREEIIKKEEAIQLSDLIDKKINKTIANYDKSYEIGNNPFEELLSMGELVDRLSVINFKLYTLKDEVMKRTDDEKFKGWASVEDVKLCRERSRLKACIDLKMVSMISRVVGGEKDGGFNEEVKKYGDKEGKLS